MSKKSRQKAQLDQTIIGCGISTVNQEKDKDDYYILEHLVGSHYHEVGEKQEIRLDEVLLGRDEDCQVRFDESFETVSRHHASIVRDGDNWRLVQLSQTNTTFLNGQPLQESWFLQSGDEIQLAVNGPKLIFRKPTDTSGMNLTQRLDSFRETTTRPYKKAIIIICSVVVLLIIGGIISAVVIHNQRNKLREQEATIQNEKEVNEQQRKDLKLLIEENTKTLERLEKTDSANNEAQAQLAILALKQLQDAANNAKTKAEFDELKRKMDSIMNSIDHSLEEGSEFNGIENDIYFY